MKGPEEPLGSNLYMYITWIYTNKDEGLIVSLIVIKIGTCEPIVDFHYCATNFLRKVENHQISSFRGARAKLKWLYVRNSLRPGSKTPKRSLKQESDARNYALYGHHNKCPLKIIRYLRLYYSWFHAFF